VKKSSTDGTSTIYVGGVYEKHQDGSYVTYYNGFGRRIAMRVHSGPGDPGTKHFPPAAGGLPRRPAYRQAGQPGSTACPSGSTVLSARERED
jgi:hypothetical protein